MNDIQDNLRSLPGQVVLVLQGGGALGAYQAGVYQALMEGGIEPDWVIGTSIGAINADSLPATSRPIASPACATSGRCQQEPISSAVVDLRLHWPTCRRSRAASRASSRPIRRRSGGRVSPWDREGRILLDRSAQGDARSPGRFRVSRPPDVRLSVGAVNVRTSEMRYFDSRDATIGCACHGIRCVAAGLPCDRHRGRILLGWRHLLEHADRGGARRCRGATR